MPATGPSTSSTRSRSLIVLGSIFVTALRDRSHAEDGEADDTAAGADGPAA